MRNHLSRKAIFLMQKGWPHKRGSTVFNSDRSQFKLMSLNEKEITPFRNTFTEIVNGQNAKRCIGGIKLCFKVCICLGFYDSYCRFILVIIIIIIIEYICMHYKYISSSYVLQMKTTLLEALSAGTITKRSWRSAK